MAMLTRPTNIKIFGSAALAAELTDFGGNTPTTDINTILNNVASERGWGTVGANGFPPMEWFNALGYALSYYSAYIMQSGIPAWTSLQNYYVNSYAVGSDGKLYRSKTGINGTPNVGNNPVGDTTNWESAADVAGQIHNATAENPGDTDELGYWDSLTLTLRKVTLANFKATLKTYFDTIYATLSSPAFTGTPTAPTPLAGDNSTKIATTAWAKIGFAISLGTNGYIKFPDWMGGVILQWGKTAAVQSSTITFPIAFPTACTGVFVISTASENANTYTSAISLTQFTHGGNTWTATGFAAKNWFAIGY